LRLRLLAIPLLRLLAVGLAAVRGFVALIWHEWLLLNSTKMGETRVHCLREYVRM
jgi:hypothetical protein